MSIGIVCDIIENDTMNIEKIIHEADKGLYYAKNHGINQMCACDYNRKGITRDAIYRIKS